jgi:O-acetyl-ADP-ribose deacetylase (regulator of RNase III)
MHAGCTLAKGYKLAAKFVIQTVGPKWNGGTLGEREKLASCSRRCIELARQHELQTLAFPGISTGILGYPLREPPTPHSRRSTRSSNSMRCRRVIMCTYDARATTIMREAMTALRA